MSQKDSIHDVVKNALIKDGWTIVADPYTIVYGRTQLYADLCAERHEAQGSADVIVVEIKSFRRSSAMYEFHQALGQYISHRDLLMEWRDPTASIWLSPMKCMRNCWIMRRCRSFVSVSVFCSW